MLMWLKYSPLLYQSPVHVNICFKSICTAQCYYNMEQLLCLPAYVYFVYYEGPENIIFVAVTAF
uniref:Uncharacterized protein n=1 Tax=Anguilla anguilla TaxID=7936 RepID=A0A0E9PGL4_ANGAN